MGNLGGSPRSNYPKIDEQKLLNVSQKKQEEHTPVIRPSRSTTERITEKTVQTKTGKGSRSARPDQIDESYDTADRVDDIMRSLRRHEWQQVDSVGEELTRLLDDRRPGEIDDDHLDSILGAAVVFLGAYLLHRRYNTEQPVQVQSDEGAVLAVIDQHDGQTKQPAIRDALDWSATKASRVTSRLEDDGKIEKLQLGRENIVRKSED